MPRPRRGQPVGPIKPGTMKRFVKYVMDKYRVQLIVVVICIVLAALGSSCSNVFLQQIIDKVIVPGMSSGLDSVYSKFLEIIAMMGTVYLVSVAATTIYTQIMASVTQGALKLLRDDMFNKMETLPIRYFDTHAHGDIMSTYTNDVDTIRQMLGQVLPTVIQSVLTIAVVVFMMLRYSFDMSAEAEAIESAVNKALDDGYRCVDIYDATTDDSKKCIGCKAMGDVVAERVSR